MALTGTELLMNANLFKLAFPNWPGVTPMPKMITETQALAIRVLYGKLGRPVPELIHLTFDQAGDLIMAVRADLLALDGKD